MRESVGLSGSRWRWVATATLLLAAMAMSGWGAGWLAERQATHRVTESMSADARLRAALLASEIARFRLLPLALGGDRDVMAALRNETPAASRALDRKLERLAKETGATVIYVLDREGDTIAASNWRTDVSFVGKNYRFRRYFVDAMRDGDAAQFALGTVSGHPGLFLSRRAAGGVIVVKLEFDRLERQWAAASGLTIVENREGVVLIASDPAMRFATTQPMPIARRRSIAQELRLPNALRRWPRRNGNLSVSVPARVGDWRLTLVQSRRAALGSVVWTARAAGAGIVLLLGMVALLVALRRRRQIRARQVERARTTELEAVVAARTADLRREIEERQASELHAASLREGLRQANRLATLGQVTASVAHETAQPVAAIRTYAAAGMRLLERGDTATLQSNLEAIDRLAARIGSVTAELRGFARKGSKPIGPVALDAMIEGARLILKERMRAVALTIDPVPHDLAVLAGRVRAEQILVNLLQNAVEALEAVPQAAIAIEIDADAAHVRLRVRDNGPGIAPDIADRLFTPFSTSRENGLGLGLVIAQDIAHDLGGTLRLVPSDRGACFELTLRRAA